MFDFQDKKILITGHTGFKGSWLVLWLKHLGANVAGFSLPSDCFKNEFHFHDLGINRDIVDYRGDIVNIDELRRSFEEYEPEIVFHLAAQSLVKESYRDPIKTFQSNAVGTLNILECIRNCPSVKVAVLVTSDKCYRNDEQIFGYRETDYLGGHDPYSASKSCAEIIAHSYFYSFMTNDFPLCATARAGNVIGGGDWSKDRILPDCAKAWYEHKSAILRNPKSTRPWQLVLEPLSGYLHLADVLYKNPTGKFGNYSIKNESFNFGPPSSINHTVREIAEQLKKYWEDFEYETNTELNTKAKESGLLKLCCDKASTYLGWEANLSIEETMRFTASWYKEYRKNQGNSKKIRELSLSQIISYEEIAKKHNRIWAI